MYWTFNDQFMTEASWWVQTTVNIFKKWPAGYFVIRPNASLFWKWTSMKSSFQRSWKSNKVFLFGDFFFVGWKQSVKWDTQKETWISVQRMGSNPWVWLNSEEHTAWLINDNCLLWLGVSKNCFDLFAKRNNLGLAWGFKTWTVQAGQMNTFKACLLVCFLIHSYDAV